MADDAPVTDTISPFSESELIRISPAMVDAGVREMRDLRYGDDLRKAVYEIYLAMEIERRDGGPDAGLEPVP